MNRILVLQTSARQTGSMSREYTQRLVGSLQTKHPAAEIVVRDLGAEPIPHLDETLLGGWMKPEDEKTDAERAAAARSQMLIDELFAADTLVIGSAMYNFGITSTLKSWLDHVLSAGRTFRYTENGPVGLAGGRKVYVVTARGGRYTDSPMDHQEPYLRSALGFIGLDDIEFIHVEGQAMGEQEAAKGREEAARAIDSLFG
jgi:FMN-dependent NADH-azoreductase